MVQFEDLPLELLPVILSHLLQPHHLAASCLVSKSFHAFATPLLYKRASIYSWHRQGKAKVIQLFDTLSRCPHLAKYVTRLEIRDFPKAFTTAGVGILDMVLKALRNCVNLRACTWTRDGSLNSFILETLQQCHKLEELEINGHNDGNYDPSLLLEFTRLRRISLIMPSGPVVGALNPWMALTGRTVRSLTLICKTSPIITDGVLESLGSTLVNLEHFHIAGCPKVTERGIWAMISNNIKGVVGLGLEALSQRFDMAEFTRHCTQSGALARLRSITLTVHQQTSVDIWMQDVLRLLSASPLETFQIYSIGAIFESPATDNFWSKIVTTHSTSLTRFSVHRMLISLDAIDDICRRCARLEQLFVVVEQDALGRLGLCLSHAKKLRSVHINSPLEAHTDSLPVISPTDALAVIRQSSSTVTQFGCNAKVWQVDKAIIVDKDGNLSAEPRLSPYESPDIPEPFLVVRA